MSIYQERLQNLYLRSSHLCVTQLTAVVNLI
jgi:hypothetical protein